MRGVFSVPENLAEYSMGRLLIEFFISDGTQEWKCLRVPLSGLLLNKRPDSFDVRASEWAGTVRGYALSQAHAAGAGAAGRIGLVQDLLLLFLGEC